MTTGEQTLIHTIEFHINIFKPIIQAMLAPYQVPIYRPPLTFATTQQVALQPKLVHLRIFFQPHQRLLGMTVDLSRITNLRDLHLEVLDFMKRQVTFVTHNPNDYILVRGNYLPLEDLGQLQNGLVGYSSQYGIPDGGSLETLSSHQQSIELILITRQQFLAMVSHIKGESERMRQKPLQKFAQQLRDQYAQEEREERGLGNSYAGGCGTWNLGDGNVYDNDDELLVRLEALPPAEREEKKESGLDPKRNIFGERGERLKLVHGSTVVLDDDDEITEIIAPTEASLKKQRRKVFEDENSSSEQSDPDEIEIISDNSNFIKKKRKPEFITVTHLPPLAPETPLIDEILSHENRRSSIVTESSIYDARRCIQKITEIPQNEDSSKCIQSIGSKKPCKKGESKTFSTRPFIQSLQYQGDEQSLEYLPDSHPKPRIIKADSNLVGPGGAQSDKIQLSEDEPLSKIRPFRKRLPRGFDTVDDLIDHNKNRYNNSLRTKLHTIQLTGEIPLLGMQRKLDKYYQKKVLTGSDDKPDFEQFDLMRENASSGINSIQSTTNLVIQNELLKESSSMNQAQQNVKDDDFGDIEFKPAINPAGISIMEGESSRSRTPSTVTPTFINDERMIMAEIPGDESLNNIDRNYDLNYKPYETRDFDFIRVPKHENLLSIECVDFYEFQRVFNCTRSELIHLIKGLAHDRQFAVTIQGDHVAKCYRLVGFHCSDSRYKKRERDLYMDKCTFYLQYLEEPDMPNVFRLHSFNKYHTHHCKRRIVWNMSDYYQRKQSLITHEPRSFDRNSKRDWRTEFMKSLTYELTTVYAEQIVQSIQQKTDKEAREAIQQMSDDMDNRNHKRALMGRIRRGERGGDKILEKVQGKGYGMRELPAPGSTKQIVRDLNIDKELYFERHINKYGMEQKL